MSFGTNGQEVVIGEKLLNAEDHTTHNCATWLICSHVFRFPIARSRGHLKSKLKKNYCKTPTVKKVKVVFSGQYFN